jgi:hypothetical protein
MLPFRSIRSKNTLFVVCEAKNHNTLRRVYYITSMGETGDNAMTEKIKRWDTAEHLRSNEEIDAYLESSFADGDEKQILRAIDNATRARESRRGLPASNARPKGSLTPKRLAM